MTEQDIATRRVRDLERYHRRVAERRAAGLCLKCGKRPPAPHRSQCEPCAEKRRPADLARHHRRSAERAALGLCPKCGKQPPAPDRTLCGPCAEKRNRASRARDARLRVAGMPRRDAKRAREYERERSRREVEQRRAAGSCVRCGRAPVMAGHAMCEPCAEQRRARERARYASAKAEGKLYGGRKVETRRRIGRERSRKRDEIRRAAGLCTGCGRHPPVEGGASWNPAARRAVPPNGRCTPLAGLPGCAARAAAPPPTATRAARPAPSPRPRAIRGRTPPGARSTPGARPSGGAPIAERRRRGPRGASRAPATRMNARRISGRCRSSTRSSPWSTSRRATSTAPTTPGRMSRWPWPSRGCLPSGSRC